jgi:hypothetical protein
MDGVLADFDRSIEENDFLRSLRESTKFLANNLRKKINENKIYGEDWHLKDLGTILKGPQTDADLDRLKRKFHFTKSKTFQFASEPGFFISLNKMVDADDLVCEVTKLSNGKLPHILSSPLESSKTCIEEKREWIHRNYGGKVDRVLIEKDKSKYSTFYIGNKISTEAARNRNILIDDTPKKIREFIEAGGIGILHTSAESSISELKKIINQD